MTKRKPSPRKKTKADTIVIATSAKEPSSVELNPYLEIERRFKLACEIYPRLKPKIDGHERMLEHIADVEQRFNCLIE